ncbi:hypothetical protein ACIQOW_27840 [Kitasatospora sp. NPDC091335]|uniref:hypothetical protein n=1 Tax=Kitasatospora sp. NPDC091335 TaxID=3364085 RepID=UPI00380E0558
MRADHDILVEVPDLRPPTVHTLNADALERIWASVCHLPMSRFQHYALERRLTGPCARRDILRDLAGAPVLVLPLGDRELRISWANPTREPT